MESASIYNFDDYNNINYYFTSDANNTTTLCDHEVSTPCKLDDQYQTCTYAMIGAFICTEPYGVGFTPMYEIEYTDDNKCCIKPIKCVNTIKVDVTEVCLIIEYGMIYKITYKHPITSDEFKQTILLLKIVSVTRLLSYNYEGVIRRYTIYGSDIYFIELTNKQHVQILNPEKLMPIRVARPTNLGSSGTHLTTMTNNYTYYEKVILQGTSFDDIVDCKCSRRFMHLYSVSYYGRKCL